MRARTAVGLLLLAIIAVAVFGTVSMLRHGFSTRDDPTAIEAFLGRRMRSMAMPRAARDMANPLPAGEATLASARAHFADHCAGCHGNDGRGQTTIGRNLYPRSPDMTQPTTQRATDGELFYVIKNGVRLTGMPAWGEDTPEDDRSSWELVHFIRHLPDITSRELAEMEALNPRSPQEVLREDAERRFLAGEDVAIPETHSGHSH